MGAQYLHAGMALKNILYSVYLTEALRSFLETVMTDIVANFYFKEGKKVQKNQLFGYVIE